MKSINRIMNLTIFVAIAAVFTAALCVSYELGRIDGTAAGEARMVLATQEARERRQVVTAAPQKIPVVEVAAVPEVPTSCPSVTSSYREDVPLSEELQAVLLEACNETGVEVTVALGLMEVESDFNPDCVSICNCYGLMQLNPLYFPDNLDSADNIRVGVAHLADCIARYNDLEAGLRAYNRGFDDGDRVYSRAVLEAAERWRGVLYGE